MGTFIDSLIRTLKNAVKTRMKGPLFLCQAEVVL